MGHGADRSGVHDVFADTLGFPDVYGRNLDAWIDCLTERDEDDGMAAIVVRRSSDPRAVIPLATRRSLEDDHDGRWRADPWTAEGLAITRRREPGLRRT